MRYHWEGRNNWSRRGAQRDYDTGGVIGMVGLDETTEVNPEMGPALAVAAWKNTGEQGMVGATTRDGTGLKIDLGCWDTSPSMISGRTRRSSLDVAEGKSPGGEP